MKILYLAICVATIFIVNMKSTAQNHQSIENGLLDQDKNPTIKLLNTIGKEDSDRDEYDFNIPTDIVLIEKQIIIVDAGSHQIKFFDLDGKFIKRIGKKGSNSSEFYYPYSIDVNSKGIIYISDLGNDRIQLFDQNGGYLNDLPFTTGNMRINSSNIISVTKAHGYFNYAIQNFDDFGMDSNILLLSKEGEKKDSLSEKLKYNNAQMDSQGNEVYVDFDKSNNILVTYLYRNLIEKFDSSSNLLWRKELQFDFDITIPDNKEVQTDSFKEISMNKCLSGIAVDNIERIWVLTMNRQLNKQERVRTDLNAMRGFDGKKKITINVSNYVGSSTTNAFLIDVFSPRGDLLTSIPITHFVDNIRIFENKLFLIDSFHSQQVYIYEIVD